MEVTKEQIAEMLTGLASSFEAETRKTDAYKNMFKAVEGDNFKGLLRALDDEMSGAALKAMQAYEDKTGKRVSNEQFEMLYALPWLAHHLEKVITKEQGFSCCVDKVFEVLNNVMIDTQRKDK